MAQEDTRLYFEDFSNRIRTKFSIPGVWFITLNVKDATLVLWKDTNKDSVSCGILLKSVSNTSKILEVLAMKDGGGFVRFTLEPKLMDRKMFKTALGASLMSAEKNQISMVINDVLRQQPSYKLLERESFKRAISSRVFGVLPKAVAYYLPHPEAASKDATHQAPATRVESDSKEDREIARDIKASPRHEAEKMVAAKVAKAAKSSKDKGKSVVVEAPRKKPSVPTQASKEKLLDSSIAAENARLSRDSKTDSGKRKWESQIIPLPPPKAPVVVAAETSEDEESGYSDKDQGDATDSGSDSPPSSQHVNKNGAN
ncbi:hypothetical protein R1sor_002830 [Riccia sorocarpa]|uniref:Uncharacterized protein n=1 Tax=Riccia sorocarpa TaxID=122646 RepID=A0ABD3H096_9MARC